MVDRTYVSRRGHLDSVLNKADNNTNVLANQRVANLATARLRQQQNKENATPAESPTTVTETMAPTRSSTDKTTITVNKAKYKQMEREHKQWKKDIKKAQSMLNRQEEELKKRDEEVADKDENIADLQEEAQQKDQWILQAKTKLVRLQDTIISLQETLRKNGKVVVTERKQDMVKHIIEKVKKYLFCNYKFIENELDQVEATRDIIAFLEIDLGLPEEAFISLYGGVVLRAVDDHRGYIQQMCKNLALEYWEEHKTIPTPEQLLKIWDLCDMDLELPENKNEYDLLIWYVDKYLPACAGQKWFGPALRQKNFPVEKVAIGGNELKVLVPISTEAVGILITDNCYDKWVNIANWKKDDPKRPIPKTGPDAAQFEAKWSDCTVGQVKYGGWKPECFPIFQGYIDAVLVQKAREVDEANDWTCQKYALDLLQKKYKVGLHAEDEASNKVKRGKKRKAPEPPAERRLTCLNE